MNSYRNATLRETMPSMPELQLLPRAAMPRITMTQTGWHVADQGARLVTSDGIVGSDGCDVTATKFSPRLGPPSCSPPV